MFEICEIMGQMTTPRLAPIAYPTIAAAIPMAAISKPLLNQFPIVILAFTAPEMKSVSVDTTRDVDVAAPTERKKKQAGVTTEPMKAEMPTTKALLPGFVVLSSWRLSSSFIMISSHNFLLEVIFFTMLESRFPLNPFL